MGFSYYAGTAGGNAGGVTADNGLTETSGNIQLGGLLLDPTFIDATGQELLIGGANIGFEISDNNNGEIGLFASTVGGSLLFQSEPNTGEGINRLRLDSGIDLSVNDNTGIGEKGLIIPDSTIPGITVTDGLTQIGLVYDTDYSPNGEANDRWIPDIGYVKSLLGSTDNGNILNGSATSALFTYHNSAVNALYEIGGALEQLSGIGSVVLNCSYTDWTGSPQTISFLDTKNLMVQAGSDIAVQATVIGIATYNAAAYIKFLF
jgi:hypothetical protein